MAEAASQRKDQIPLGPVQEWLDALQVADRRAAEQQPGEDYLRFLCAGVPCAAPLRMLKEVLLTAPQPVFLPFSPRWMLGICPLRLELVGLVDPVPMLLGGLGDGPAFMPAESSTPAFPTLSLDGSDHDSLPALVLSDEGTTLACVVQAVGDVARITAQEIASSPERITAARLPFVDRYVAGIYAASPGDQPHVVLNIGQLLTDLVEALREKDGGHG